jgi:long-chain acyl-CoA synthetase
LLERTAARTPKADALVFEDQRLTYSDINRQANCLAAALQARGVQMGDRVATLLDNSAQAVVSVWATLKCGAVVMPINPLTKRDKLAYLLNDARASVLIAHAVLMPEVSAALTQNGSLHTVMVVGTSRDSQPLDARCAALPALDVDAPEVTSVALTDQDLAAIIYTSGSTGEPKGVMLTHLNMRSAARSVSSYLQLQSTDRISCALPLAFDYGLYQVLMAARVGACVVLERSFAFPVKVLEGLARECITVFPGVPTMFSLLMNLKLTVIGNLPHLRLITNTAAALSEHHIQQLRALFPQAQLYSMYGLTECKRVTYLPPDQLDARPSRLLGQARRDRRALAHRPDHGSDGAAFR